MSSNYSRTTAVRTFAGELAAATTSTRFSEDEKAPTFQILPSGTAAHRVFIVGTVTEVNDVGDGSEYWRARVVDPNGDTFYVFAGQYQPEAASVLRELEAPAYVSVVGKTDTFEGDDGETFVSLTAEEVAQTDQRTHDRWVVETAERTLDRIEAGQAGEQAPDIDREVDELLFEQATAEYGAEAAEEAREAALEAVATLTDDVKSEGGKAASAAAD